MLHQPVMDKLLEHLDGGVFGSQNERIFLFSAYSRLPRSSFCVLAGWVSATYENSRQRTQNHEDWTGEGGLASKGIHEKTCVPASVCSITGEIGSSVDGGKPASEVACRRVLYEGTRQGQC